MTGARPLAIVLAWAAVALAIAAVAAVSPLGRSAADYGLHHEVTVPLCRCLALVCLSLGGAVTAARLAGGAAQPFTPLVALAWPAVAALIAAIVLANEAFFGLLDPKGFPVHPIEPVIFPDAGWHGLASHLLAAALLTGAFAWVWWVGREKS